MKLHRIYALVLRFMYLFRHSSDRQADIFFWPIMDLLLWGLTGTFFASQSGNGNLFVTIIASGILLWLVVWRGQYEITVNLLEDLWNKNLINIFGAPLLFSEWVAAFLSLGIIKALISGSFAALLAYLLYHVSIFKIGLLLVPFFVLLIMTGWAVGFVVAGLIMRHGTKIQNLAWSMVFVIAPFTGIYYPISVLPHWAQIVSYAIPTTYIFESSRTIISGGQIDMRYVYICLALNIVYITAAILFLKRSFAVRMDKGLQKIQG